MLFVTRDVRQENLAAESMARLGKSAISYVSSGTSFSSESNRRMGLGLVPLHDRNDVFARLRLVISQRFRLVGSTTRTLSLPLSLSLSLSLFLSSSSLVGGTCATDSNNGHDIALQFATGTPRISSPGKTRQKFLPENDEISINSLDVALSSAELYKRTPETSSRSQLV